MDREQKAKIIRFCKEFIEEHGTVRVGWAAEQILSAKQPHHIRAKIANTIIQTGEYLKEDSKQLEKDWNILKNPNYKKEKWTEKHPILRDFIVGTIAAIFSLAVGIILWSIQAQAADVKYEKLEKQINDINLRVDSLINHQDKTKIR